MLIAIRIIQSFFISDVSFFGLKWLLLGEWLGKGFSMYSQAFDYTGPIAAMVYTWLDALAGRSPFLHIAMSTCLIIVQAGIFNRLLLKNKAYDENSYLPSFLYMILAVSVPDFMALSPQLMSLTFVLITLGNVLRRIDNQVTDELFLNSGIYIGLATMIYIPAVVFFLVFLFSFILFSTAVTRRLLLYLFGFLLIFALCSLYFYWFDSLSAFIDSFLLEGLFMDVVQVLKFGELLLLFSPFIAIFFLAIIKTWTVVRLNNFQQKVQQVLWLMFFGGLATFFLSNEKSGHELLFLIPIVCYFWTHYFILIKRRIFRAIMPGLLIFGLLIFSCFSYGHLTKPLTIEKTSEYIDGVMILGEKLEAYAELQINTPFFNQKISERAVKGLDYYPSAGVIYELLQKSDPTFIVDEMEIMPKLRARYRFLEENYRRADTNSYRKINN